MRKMKFRYAMLFIHSYTENYYHVSVKIHVFFFLRYFFFLLRISSLHLVILPCKFIILGQGTTQWPLKLYLPLTKKAPNVPCVQLYNIHKIHIFIILLSCKSLSLYCILFYVKTLSFYTLVLIHS